jgi:hypothetical protein
MVWGQERGGEGNELGLCVAQGNKMKSELGFCPVPNIVFDITNKSCM